MRFDDPRDCGATWPLPSRGSRSGRPTNRRGYAPPLHPTVPFVVPAGTAQCLTTSSGGPRTEARTNTIRETMQRNRQIRHFPARLLLAGFPGLCTHLHHPFCDICGVWQLLRPPECERAYLFGCWQEQEGGSQGVMEVFSYLKSLSSHAVPESEQQLRFLQLQELEREGDRLASNLGCGLGFRDEEYFTPLVSFRTSREESPCHCALKSLSSRVPLTTITEPGSFFTRITTEPGRLRTRH